MNIKYPSDTTEQLEAHASILALFNEKFKFKLENKKVFLKETLFQIDGYSEFPPVLCEIYCRVGKMKAAQFNKIGKDILKMLLIEKMQGKLYRKIILFADDEAARSFIGGESWYSRLKDYFNVEVIVIEIPGELRDSLLIAQKRQ